VNVRKKMTMAVIRTVVLLLLAVSISLTASESPRVLFAVDASRSSADDALVDRLRLIADGVLPGRSQAQVVLFTDTCQQLPTGSFGSPGLQARQSDYYLLFADTIAPWADAGPGIVILTGDGIMEVVGSQLHDRPYLTWLDDPRPTRAAINQAVRGRLLSDFSDLVSGDQLQFVLADTAGSTGAEDSVLRWITDSRPNSPLLPQDAPSLIAWLQALQRSGVLPAHALPKAVAGLSRSGAGELALSIPECSKRVDLLLNSTAADYAWTVLLDGRPVAQDDRVQVEVIDDAGVARHLVLSGCEAGVELSVRLEGPGTLFEAVPLLTREATHQLGLDLPTGQRGLFAGDKPLLTHTFTRTDGEPLSAKLHQQVFMNMVLSYNGKKVSPAGEALQEGELHIQVDFPDYPWIQTTDIHDTVAQASALKLIGGFDQKQIFAGTDMRLALTRQGGKRVYREIPLSLQGDGDASQKLVLQPDPKQADRYLVSLPTDDQLIGTWQLPQQLSFGLETAQIVISDDRHGSIAVVWDWRLLAAILGAVLLLLLAILLWYLLTLPRWKEELFLDADGQHPLTAFPGPTARCTSYGSDSLNQGLLLQKTRQGYTAQTTGEGLVLYRNGQRVPDGEPTELINGNDLELVGTDGQRQHGRFFIRPDDAEGWTAEQAQIDLEADFESQHFIIEV